MSGKGFRRNYPKGRISGDDNGETRVGIAYDPKNDLIIIKYSEPTEWIGLDAESAAQLIVVLHNHLQKMQIPADAIQRSMITGGAFSNQALTAAATTLIGGSKQVGMPMMVRCLAEETSGLAPGQSRYAGEAKPNPGCLGIAIGVECNDEEARELIALIDEWDAKRKQRREGES